MMMNLKSILVVALSVILGLANAGGDYGYNNDYGSYGNNNYNSYNNQPPHNHVPQLPTIWRIVRRSDSFDILESAIAICGLDAELNDPSVSYTLFAPTDRAFKVLFNEVFHVDSVHEIDIDTLTDILLYHLVEGKYFTNLVTYGSVATLEGSSLVLKPQKHSGGLFVNDAYVVTADISASNGVVHAINSVLLPPQGYGNGGGNGNGYGYGNDYQAPPPPVVYDPYDPSDPQEIFYEDYNTNGRPPNNVGPPPRDDDDDVGVVDDDDAGASTTTDDVGVVDDDGPSFTDDVGVVDDDGPLTNGDDGVVDDDGVDDDGPWTNGDDNGRPPNNGYNGPPNNNDYNDEGYNYNDYTPAYNDYHDGDYSSYGDYSSGYSLPNLVEIINERGRFNILQQCLRVAGLKLAVRDSEDVTIFAPCNRAFEDLFVTLRVDSCASISLGLLQEILLHHIIGDVVIFAEDIKDGQRETTLEGSDVVFSLSYQYGWVFVNDAKILEADIVASNGIIHAINKVLVPPKDYGYDYAYTDKRSSDYGYDNHRGGGHYGY